MNLFKRLGKCNHCGFCCEYAVLGSFPKDRATLTKDEETYLSRFDACAVETKDNIWLVIKHPCRYYDTINRRCNDHLDRPTVCRTFPDNPNNPYLLIMDKWGVKCGYRFVEDE